MNIKLIGTDIDGVWTDAKMYYTDKGDYMKAYSQHMMVWLYRYLENRIFQSLF